MWLLGGGMLVEVVSLLPMMPVSRSWLESHLKTDVVRIPVKSAICSGVVGHP